MRQLTLVTFILFLLASCQGQLDNGIKYNTEFKIGDIPNLSEFITLNKDEKLLDSLFGSYDKSIDSLATNDSLQKLATKREFIENRSRLLLTEVSNGIENIKDKDKIEKDGISTFCECSTFKDTLFIRSGIGFFGGAALLIKVYKDQFASSFYQYIDDVKPYKLNASSEFTNDITVESKYQYLLIDKAPTYEIGQQLRGFLTLTSNNFYEKRYGEKLDTTFVKVQLKFTCKTKNLERLP